MPYGRPDLIDAHAQLTERVRKLEVMHQSRTLIPKRWKPYNPAADMAYCHMIRALGLNPSAGPLPQRIPPEVDILYDSGSFPALDMIFKFWERTGYGPRYWLGDLIPYGEHYAFFSGSTYQRFWEVGGLPKPITYEEGQPAVLRPYFDGTNPPGSAPAFYMETYPGLKVFGEDTAAVPDAGYFAGAKVVGDHRLYQTPGMPDALPCQVPPKIDTNAVYGELHPYTIPVSNAGCPDNPLHPSFSLGYEDAQYGRFDHLQIQLLRKPEAVDRDHSLATIPVDTKPILSPVAASTLRDRIAIGLEVDEFKGIAGFYEGAAERAKADLQSYAHLNWQRLPLFPPWWGTLEARYDARFVYFRGRISNGADDRAELAAFPNWLPIGPRVGSYMPGATIDGQPIQIKLDHSFRTESPNDYLVGNGSYLRIARPFDLTELDKPADGHVIVLDGCRFGIYEGPFDGSNPAYPDLRA
jgi:hypothetical protein